MNQKEAKIAAGKLAQNQSKNLQKFINDAEILLTLNQGVLEIHAFAIDDNGTKIYNHIIHKLPSRFKSRTTMNQRANERKKKNRLTRIGSGERAKMYNNLLT